MAWFGRGKSRADDKATATGENSNSQLIGQSLLRLEINTILKSNMTGEPMPPLPLALLAIISDYVVTLKQFGLEWSVIAQRLGLGVTGGAPTDRDVEDQIKPTFECFNAIRELAVELRTAREGARAKAPESSGTAGQSDRDEVVLTRIAQCSQVILDMISLLPRDGLLWRHLGMTRRELQMAADGDAAGLKLGPYDIRPTQLLRIRKIWDIGTEEIVAQTSISLTGDVLMRVSPLLLDPKQKALLDIHRDAVSMSTGYWRDIMNAALTLLKDGVSLFNPMKR